MTVKPLFLLLLAPAFMHLHNISPKRKMNPRERLLGGLKTIILILTRLTTSYLGHKTNPICQVVFLKPITRSDQKCHTFYKKKWNQDIMMEAITINMCRFIKELFDLINSCPNKYWRKMLIVPNSYISCKNMGCAKTKTIS